MSNKAVPVKIEIPRRSPEEVQAEANERYFGNTDKVATTPLRGLMVRGVEISSRYDKAHDYEVMQDMILALPDDCAAPVKSIWADRDSTYSVVLNRWNADMAGDIGRLFEQVALHGSSSFGHNGIYVSADDGDDRHSITIGPDWRVDHLDDH
jgi:hypothetical protein